MLIVERIVNDIVILEQDDLSHIKVQKSKFSYNVKNGDVVILKNGFYILDEDKTRERKEEILKYTKKIFNK